jgi:hypothetical protein
MIKGPIANGLQKPQTTLFVSLESNVKRSLFLVVAALCALGALAGATRAEEAAPAKKIKQYRGFTMNLGYGVKPEDAIKEIDHLATLGCTSMNFVFTGKQADVHAQQITVPWKDLPKPPDIQKILQHAKSKGMLVMLMPIVLLEKSGPKDWRGVIAPEDWDIWFLSYTSYINTVAKIAARSEVDVLCVGSELLSTETFRDRWIKTIAEVRETYRNASKDKKGTIKLTYSANWDHHRFPTFWDKLDYIAMNNYNELADKPGVPVEELLKKWGPIKDDILKFVKEQGKPFIFSEVGWHNVQNTIKEPWNYVAQGVIDLQEQKRAFQSFVAAWSDVGTDQFMGAFVWEWVPGIDGATHHGAYTLQNTPALEVVKEWMKGAVEK